MKTSKGFFISCAAKSRRPIIKQASVLVALAVGSSVAIGAADTGKIYSTPDEAVTALKSAVATFDTNALRVIFGPAVEALYNADRVEATNDLRKFSTALMATNRLTSL